MEEQFQASSASSIYRIFISYCRQLGESSFLLLYFEWFYREYSSNLLLGSLGNFTAVYVANFKLQLDSETTAAKLLLLQFDSQRSCSCQKLVQLDSWKTTATSCINCSCYFY